MITALTKSRANLVCQCAGPQDEYIWPSALSSAEYITHVEEYLSLVKGFFANLTNIFAFCEWNDLLSNTATFEANANQEYSQTLLAAGIVLMNFAAKQADNLLIARDIDDQTIKQAYTALLQAAGVFNACTVSLGQQPSTIGAEPANLATSTPVVHEQEVETVLSPTAAEMDMWRKEQQEVQNKTKNDNREEDGEEEEKTEGDHQNVAVDSMEMSERYPDLKAAALAKVLSWISLANAQELTIFRAVTRESDRDFKLVAKLAADVSNRYGECVEFVKTQIQPLQLGTGMRLKAFCDFKLKYYDALASYYIGVSDFETDDAKG